MAIQIKPSILYKEADPLKELEKFRASPSKEIEGQIAYAEANEAEARSMGDISSARQYHDAAQVWKAAATPKFIVPKISHGTIIGRQLGLPQGWTTSGGSPIRWQVLVLLDWDDVLPGHTHHTNDLCYVVEERNSTPCISTQKHE